MSRTNFRLTASDKKAGLPYIIITEINYNSFGKDETKPGEVLPE